MKNNELDIIIPVSLELDAPTRESTVRDITEQYEKFGFKKFALACPSAGWRAFGYPPIEHYIERAKLFADIKKDLAPYDITLGWWITATVKTGHSKDFTPVIKSDGSEHPFSNCPLDPVFRERFAKSTAAFAKIAKPAFIITEDDYSVHAAAPEGGCFCHHHLAEFSRRTGREYSREELVEIFASKTPESYSLLREWRSLVRDSLVGCSERVRAELDIESPEIPMGYMQPGKADQDGDATLAVSRALAGKNHTPFSRLCGTYYGDFRAEDVPGRLYHAYYTKQHIKEDFIFYHESDTFPHMRFFSAGKEITTLMAAAYSMGFDGSTFQTQQLLDCPNEDTTFGYSFKKERKRFNAVHRIAKQCEQKGAELCYDPFWNTADGRVCPPYWTRAVSLMGIPYTTLESNIAFLDKCQISTWDDGKIKRYLAKNIFIDAEAAKLLCERGYGEYIGVSVGDEITKYEETKMFIYDLAAREIICDKYAEEGKGRNMTNPYMLANSNGKNYRMEITDPRCEAITNIYTFKRELVNVGMSRFKNKLGGNVVVMSTSISGNYSQSLLNYRRQRLIDRLITEFSDELVYVKEAARIYTIMNEARDEKASGFLGMLTLINLCSDSCGETQLHLPRKWRDGRKFYALDPEGEWKRLEYRENDDGIVLADPIDYLSPVFILCK